MKTILAIQPSATRLGYAVFEGTELVDWGVKKFGAILPVKRRMTRKAIRCLDELVYRHEPDILIFPDGRGSSSGRNVFMTAVRGNAGREAYTVVMATRGDVQRCFATFLGSRSKTAGKDVIMPLLAGWFPELKPALPNRRRIWETEDYWVPMFDAVSLAITYMDKDQ
jgi:hypothetical protein